MSPINNAIVVQMIAEKEMMEKTGYSYSVLDKVYHSESQHEMEVNADLMGVDLCNPLVLKFLADQTTYHHAFWPHTAKRFTAFKNILRHNKYVKKSLKDKVFLEMMKDTLDKYIKKTSDPLHNVPGYRQELKNIKQVVSIVEKICNET